jgi:hypothetical protein
MIYIQDGNKQEREKYKEIWTTVPDYRKHSPGLENVERFMKIMKPELGSRIIDIGAGECKAGLEFEKLGLSSWYLDITDAAKPKEIEDSKFILSPLWGDWKFPHSGSKWDYGFCCDVLEHIPPEYTMLCLNKIIHNCQVSWLQISLIEDGFGQAIGETLHLTVRPFDWWLIRLGTLGKVLDARDLIDAGLYVVTK